MTIARTNDPAGGAIDASWFDADLRHTSGAWRLMHAEEAVASGDFHGEGLAMADLLAAGWPRHAPALVSAAWWVAEALWRNGVAASVLCVADLRRARQIGLAVLAATPARAAPRSSTAAWLVSTLFDEPARTTIRLQLPRATAFDEAAGADLLRQFSPAQVARLVGHARSAMGVP